MKKNLLFAALAAGVLLMVSCKSAPAPQPEPPSYDHAFKAVYDRYRTALIFEGAGEYVVQHGDTLAHIAMSHYHDGFYYPIILLASDDVVLDPDKLEPGMKLIIPDLEKNLEDAVARENIKDFLSAVADIEDARDRAETAKGIRAHSDAL